MKKLPAVLVVLVLGAAGFAAAGIASGANLLDVLTGTTATVTGTTTGEQGPAGRRVLVCHATHSKKHPFVQIMVSEHALRAQLKHGYLGPCSSPATTGATTDATATTSSDDGSYGHGNGHGDDHGHGHGDGGGHGHH